MTWTRWTVPQVALGVTAVAVVVALLVAGSTSSVAFGAYNPAWDGASDLRSVAESADTEQRTLLSTDGYGSVAENGTAPANETVAVALAPRSAYGGSAAATVREFVRSGGTLVVADDVDGTGNELLASVGASARFDGARLRDERENHRSPAIVVASNVTSGAPGTGDASGLRAAYTAGVERLTLNHGTAVRANDASVLVRTSEFAYRDENGNGELDDAEELERRPVATVERVGDGQVVAVGDPSAFVNAMLDRPDNRQFARNLLDAERALLDYSHAGSQPPLAIATLLLRGSPALQAGIGLGLLGLIGCGSWVLGRRDPDGGRAGLPGPTALRGALVATMDDAGRSAGDAEPSTSAGTSASSEASTFDATSDPADGGPPTGAGAEAATDDGTRDENGATADAAGKP